MAAEHNIVIEQVATFKLNVTWTDPAGAPIDLTGYRVRLQIRQTTAAATKLLDFDSTSLASGMTLGTALGASGVIDIRLAPSVTASLAFQNAVYDLTVTSGGGEVSRVLEGKASVSPAVTR